MKHSTVLVLSGLALVNAQSVSKSARCGADFGLTCLGSKFGSCCSQYGYCGSTTAYCGTGCNAKFGTCSGVFTSTVRSSTLPSTLATSIRATPSSALQVTKNARCGKGYGFTCQGSQWGNCCSQYSYCGSTSDYCGAKTCQKGFGTCNDEASSKPSSAKSSIKSSSQSSSISSTISSTETTKTLSSSTTPSIIAPATLTAISSTASSTSISSPAASSTSSSAETLSVTTESATIASTSSITISSTLSSTGISSPAASSTSSSSAETLSATSDSSVTPVPSSTTIPSTIVSSTPSSSIAPVSTPFCLRVTTPNLRVSNYVVTSNGEGYSFLLRATGNTGIPIAFFNLAPSGQLVTKSGLIVAVNDPPQPQQAIRPFTAEDIASGPPSDFFTNPNPAPYPIETCSITTNNELDCIASGSGYTWTNFAFQQGDQFNYMFVSVADLNGLIAIKLGVFYGSDCV